MLSMNNLMSNTHTKQYFTSMVKSKSIVFIIIFLDHSNHQNCNCCVRTTVTDGAVTDEEKIIFYWSTESTLNDMHNHLLRPALTSSSEVDTDRNGLMDR